MSKVAFIFEKPEKCEDCRFFVCSSVGEWFQCCLDYHGVSIATKEE